MENWVNIELIIDPTPYTATAPVPATRPRMNLSTDQLTWSMIILRNRKKLNAPISLSREKLKLRNSNSAWILKRQNQMFVASFAMVMAVVTPTTATEPWPISSRGRQISGLNATPANCKTRWNRNCSCALTMESNTDDGKVSATLTTKICMRILALLSSAGVRFEPNSCGVNCESVMPQTMAAALMHKNNVRNIPLSRATPVWSPFCA